MISVEHRAHLGHQYCVLPIDAAKCLQSRTPVNPSARKKPHCVPPLNTLNKGIRALLMRGATNDSAVEFWGLINGSSRRTHSLDETRRATVVMKTLAKS